MSPEEKARKFKAWAHDEGFDRVGVASLRPELEGAVTDQGRAFLDWLERGDHAGMEWMKNRTEARLDPAQVLDGARSVICVALQYAPLEDPEGRSIPDETGDLWPRVARYARGRDYHDVMIKSLRRLGARITEAFPASTTRSYVDTGPVLERQLAARAGLGVQGKNTLLLHRDAGSWFLLGELFTTLDLTPDDPVSDLCGRCTRCLDHCPTGALPEPYRLDAGRCISYWTIEHRGDVPDDVREMVGDWVFGCDICQEVCPWNMRGPEGAHHPELELPEARRELDLIGLLTLERDDYTARFTKSPMKRTKLEGLQRNAAVAMGNRRDRRYLPALREAAADNPSEVVRRQARLSIEAIESVE